MSKIDKCEKCGKVDELHPKWGLCEACMEILNIDIFLLEHLDKDSD